MCFYDDGDSPVMQEATTPRARREYRCYECRQAIASGETYHSYRSLYDGAWSTVRTCVRCEAVRKHVAEIESARGCRGAEAWCPFGELASAIRDDGQHYGLLLDGPERVTECPDDPGFVDDDGAEIVGVSPLAAHLFPGVPVLADA